MPKVEVAKVSDKANSAENKAARASQSVGNVKLNDREVFEIVKDGKHLKKGDKVSLCKPTKALFKHLGYIK
jgi:hypothetical protein